MRTEPTTLEHAAASILWEYAAEIEASCMSGEREWACKDCDHGRLCQRDRWMEVVTVARVLSAPTPWWRRLLNRFSPPKVR